MESCKRVRDSTRGGGGGDGGGGGGESARVSVPAHLFVEECPSACDEVEEEEGSLQARVVKRRQMARRLRDLETAKLQDQNVTLSQQAHRLGSTLDAHMRFSARANSEREEVKARLEATESELRACIQDRVSAEEERDVALQQLEALRERMQSIESVHKNKIVKMSENGIWKEADSLSVLPMPKQRPRPPGWQQKKRWSPPTQSQADRDTTAAVEVRGRWRRKPSRV